MSSLAITFDLFYVPGHALEVRALGISGNSPIWDGWASGVVSGYYDNKEKFVKDVAALDKAGAEGVYVTLNPVSVDLLARANNRLKGLKRSGATTVDADVVSRRWVMIDCDPIRPSGISSTQEELDLSYRVAHGIWESLKAEYGEGIIAVSGNGCHLLYRTDSPNDEASKHKLQRFLQNIAAKHTTDRVDVDGTVFNAGRITKLYGTAARKGESIPTRPHRTSKYVKFPSEIGFIALQDLPDPPPREVKEHSGPGESVERIESALATLPQHLGPNSYDKWVGILMAVHSELGDAAVPLLERYIPGTEGEIEAKCAGFSGSGTSISTLYGIAKEYGWNPSTHTEPADDYTEPEQIASADDIDAILSGDIDDRPALSIYNYRAEEGGVLDAFLDRHGDGWRYFLHTGAWHQWDNGYWCRNQTDSISVEIQTLLLEMNTQAHDLLRRTEDKDVQKFLRTWILTTKRTSSRVNSIENMARPHMTVDATQNNKLNLSNGTLDLDTLEVADHDRSDGMDYILPYAYDPAARCPLFVQFLMEVLVHENTTETDHELVAVIQEFMGYSLSNDTSHHAMVWLSGEGANGKSVLIGIINELLGPLAVAVDFQTIDTPGNYDRADLAGKRVAFATEANPRLSFAQGTLKNVVAGDKIRGRHIMNKPFEFVPTCKVWWAMNDKPQARYSHSIWRRLLLIPFNRVFDADEQDVSLGYKLRQELPGILNFALVGLQRLRRQGGFTNAAAVTAAKDEYARDSSPVLQWIERRTERLGFANTHIETLYQDYRAWCISTGHLALADNAFGRELRSLKIKNERRTSGRYYALNITGDAISISIPMELGI